MRSRASWGVVLWAALGMAALAGCAQDPPAAYTVARDPDVVVAYVACALLPVVEDAAARFEAARAGKSVEIEVGAPGELSEGVLAGDIPDVLICIGDAEIGMLERKGLMDRMPIEALPAFRLALAVPADRGTSPIRSYEDLTSADVTAITMPALGTTSLGSDAGGALEKLGIWGKVQEKLKLTGTPLEALELVAEGGADVAIIYEPCPALELGIRVPRESVVVVGPLAPESDRRTSVHAGIHKSSPNAPLARLFLRYLEEVREAEMPAEQADDEAPDPSD